jgi:glutaconate CoA-transferase, subunit A
VDSVVEAPNGAHFTTAAPDYGRDEKFQRHYAEAAASDESWASFVQTYLSGSEADYQAAVRKFWTADAWGHLPPEGQGESGKAGAQ